MRFATVLLPPVALLSIVARQLGLRRGAWCVARARVVHPRRCCARAAHLGGIRRGGLRAQRSCRAQRSRGGEDVAITCHRRWGQVGRRQRGVGRSVRFGTRVPSQWLLECISRRPAPAVRPMGLTPDLSRRPRVSGWSGDDDLLVVIRAVARITAWAELWHVGVIVGMIETNLIKRIGASPPPPLPRGAKRAGVVVAAVQSAGR